ncbi:MAG: sarcosine oxidase subunit gamma [Sinobacteraceae bacterium]|nr:sarcosine oxidase subunit gamma [Nevskiaceae bacterium]
MSESMSGLSVASPTERFVLQADAMTLAAAAQALGFDSDVVTSEARDNGAFALLWLGPDERLILAWQDQTPQIAPRVASALADQPHSLVEVTHRQVSRRLQGQSISELLNCGCPLDLEPTQFPVGRCSRTLFNKAEIVLWRRGSNDFHVEIWRSYADYFERWLIEAAQDLPVSTL